MIFIYILQQQFNKYYGIETEVIMNKPINKTKIKTKLKIDPILINKGNTKIIGYIGSILEHRGIRKLVQATKDIENVKVVLLGPANNPVAKRILKEVGPNAIWIPPVPPYQIIEVLKRFFDIVR